jgi:Flp pilus assembly protein TadD
VTTAQTRTNISGTGGIHEIRGKIYFPSGKTLETPIEVELSGPFISLKVYTDRNGAYSFQNLAPGNYTVVVTVSDQFETAREAVTIDTEAQGRNTVPMPATPKVITVPVYLQQKHRSDSPLRNEVINAKWATVPTEAIERYQHGLELVRQNKAPEAAAEFRKSIEIYHGIAPAHTAAGKLLLMGGKIDEALEEFHTALRYDSSDFEARLSLGVGLLNKMQFNDAQKELSEAAILNKTAFTPRYYLGVVFVQTRDYDRAQKEMEAARGLIGSRSFPLLHRYLGGIYVIKNMNREAVAELETYIAQDPKARDADRIRQTIADLKAKQTN